MTLHEFKVSFLTFLENSNVNLGRRKTKTRISFLQEAMGRFDAFESDKDAVDMGDKGSDTTPDTKSVMRIEPNDRKKALDVGKGVHSMTASESARADEQLGRSPYVNKKEPENG